MADAAQAVPLYDTLSFGFVLGGDELAAGAADDWERRRDAPTAMRIAIDDGGEPQAPPAEHDAVRARAARAAARCLTPPDGCGGLSVPRLPRRSVVQRARGCR